MRRRRNMRVRKGMERRRAVRSIKGERARRKGLARRSCVVRVSVEDVVCNSLGRLTNRRAVQSESASGTSEKIRRLKQDEHFETWIRKRCHVPNRLSPRRFLVSVPHEATHKRPNRRDEESNRNENRCHDHDGSDKNTEEKYVSICHEGA